MYHADSCDPSNKLHVYWPQTTVEKTFGYNTRTYVKRTDRQTDTGRQQRPRLRIASRGYKHSSFDTDAPYTDVTDSFAFTWWQHHRNWMKHQDDARRRGFAKLQCHVAMRLAFVTGRWFLSRLQRCRQFNVEYRFTDNDNSSSPEYLEARDYTAR